MSRAPSAVGPPARRHRSGVVRSAVVGKPSTAGIDIDDETFNFPVGRRAVDAFPMLGMQAMQLLTTAEACHYLLATRKEESMEDFEDPVFFGYIDASGDDDRYVSKEGDVHVRTDFDEAIDMPAR